MWVMDPWSPTKVVKLQSNREMRVHVFRCSRQGGLCHHLEEGLVCEKS